MADRRDVRGGDLSELASGLVGTTFSCSAWRRLLLWSQPGSGSRNLSAFAGSRKSGRPCDTGDEENANQLSEKYDIPLEHARTFRFRELFTADLRKQTSLLAFSFFCFGACVVATNVYIVYWLTHFNGFSNRGAAI
jgi:hypothetical protein